MNVISSYHHNILIGGDFPASETGIFTHSIWWIKIQEGRSWKKGRDTDEDKERQCLFPFSCWHLLPATCSMSPTSAGLIWWTSTVRLVFIFRGYVAEVWGCIHPIPGASQVNMLISHVFQNWASLQSGSPVGWDISVSFLNRLRPVLQNIIPKSSVYIDNSGGSGSLAKEMDLQATTPKSKHFCPLPSK